MIRLAKDHGKSLFWTDRVEPRAIHFGTRFQRKSMPLEQHGEGDLQLHHRQGCSNTLARPGREGHEFIGGWMDGQPAFRPEFIGFREYFGDAMGDIWAHHDPRSL